MNEIPPQNLAPSWPAELDTRSRPPRAGEERETLTAFLDWHRATFELKTAGLSAEQLAEKSVAPSGMSLHGILRHLAGVERWWFGLQFAGLELPQLYYSDDNPDQDFEFTGADPAQDFGAWQAECERSRGIVAAAPSLDVLAAAPMTGEPISLRRILVTMIAEYARHNGHADLLRERLDGLTGS
ncbi:DinB family protein [Kitasatospora sp. NBC_01266]|uniref:DinB family protein n=1 Tax=Kitasatospora sp. NBC_01266 TaxID=2903572 RepID=UPI002E36A6E9|nr:DinB family protein [Kitasatospora sp. NBC_01266]